MITRKEVKILDMKTIDKDETLSDYITLSHAKKFYLLMIPNVICEHL